MIIIIIAASFSVDSSSTAKSVNSQSPSTGELIQYTYTAVVTCYMHAIVWKLI